MVCDSLGEEQVGAQGAAALHRWHQAGWGCENRVASDLGVSKGNFAANVAWSTALLNGRLSI
jgi:hypothetical protein